MRFKDFLVLAFLTVSVLFGLNGVIGETQTTETQPQTLDQEYIVQFAWMVLAVTDPDFRALLSTDIDAAIDMVQPPLTEANEEKLRDMIEDGGEALIKDFEGIGKKWVCPKWPCPGCSCEAHHSKK